MFTAHFYILLDNPFDINGSHDVSPAFSLHLAYIRLHFLYIGARNRPSSLGWMGIIHRQFTCGLLC